MNCQQLNLLTLKHYIRTWEKKNNKLYVRQFQRDSSVKNVLFCQLLMCLLFISYCWSGHIMVTFIILPAYFEDNNDENGPDHIKYSHYG